MISSVPRSSASASATIASAVACVEVLAGLVEDQQREARELRAGERDPAPLAAGEAVAAGAALGRQAVRERPRPGQQPGAGERGLQVGLARVAAGEQQVLAQRRVEHVRVLGDEPDDRADGVAVERAQLDAAERDRALVVEEAQQHRGERRLARAARADHGDAAAGREVEVDAVEHPSRPRSGPAARARAARARPAAGAGPRARAPATGASSTACTRAALRRTRASSCVAAGRPATSSKVASGTSATTASSTGSRLRARSPRPPSPHSASPVSSVTRPRPVPVVRAAAASSRVSSASSRASVRRRSGQRAVDQQLRRAVERLDRHRAQLAPAPARGPLLRAVSHGTTVAASSSATSTIAPAAGSSHHSSATVAPPAISAIANGGSDPQEQVLQRVDVVHEPRQQVALAERRAARRARAARAAGRR